MSKITYTICSSESFLQLVVISYITALYTNKISIAFFLKLLKFMFCFVVGVVVVGVVVVVDFIS